MIKKWMLLSFIVFNINQCMALPVEDAAKTVSWGYQGNKDAARWAQLHPAFALCAQGKQQSPINIKTAHLVLGRNTLVVNYTPGKAALGIDLTTDLTVGDTALVLKDGHGVQIDNQSSNETVTFNNEVYRLVQLHFHTPSENAINNVSYPMEIHFVHQGDHGKVLVLGVLVAGGENNAAVQVIANALRDGKLNTALSFTPADLLPANRDFYHFMGSLTTPPCTEGLQWLVFKTPITATPAEIVWLRKANGGANARPIQPTNNRLITLNQ